MLGPDLFNGSSANLTTFKNQIGATFPLLRSGSAGTGNENLYIPYGDRDSYAVINKQGICRYNAYNLWPYGNRYHVDELRGCIDSLVSNLAAVDGPGARAFVLEASPNPFSRRITIAFSNPGAAPLGARLTVHDLAGRLVATLWTGEAAPHSRTREVWDGRGASGERMPAGVYLIRSEVGSRRLMRRVVILP